ncbi:MAG: hypothetical protein OXG81_14325, partial [Acidobacteria bacterium]|nr:hypothetical protein [Acidobacteriota bacterium]
PNKQAKEKDVSLVEYSCVSCGKDVEDNGIECQWCCCWEHRSCAGLTVGEYNMLSTSSAKIMFFCTLCYSKVPFALKVKQETTHGYDALDSRLKVIEKQLVDSLQKYESCLNQFVSNQQDTVMVDIEETSDDNQSNVITLKSPIENLASSIIKEQNEKEKRQMNLVLYNIPESVQEEAHIRKQEDIVKVSSLLDSYLGVKVSINNAIRIGKRKEKPRLLKITVGSLQEKNMILRNKIKLREQKNPENIRKIFINVDLTPLEQRRNRQLRDKLKEMNKNTNRYIIKNGAIVQRKSQ